MSQYRTHTCGELRAADAGKTVTLAGWMENVREVGSNFAFVVLRDFYGTTQIVVDSAEMMKTVKGINKESTIAVTGTVRLRESPNTKLATRRDRGRAEDRDPRPAAATTRRRLRSTAAVRPTRARDSNTAISICATPPSRTTSFCAATSSRRAPRDDGPRLPRDHDADPSPPRPPRARTILSPPASTRASSTLCRRLKQFKRLLMTSGF